MAALLIAFVGAGVFVVWHLVVKPACDALEPEGDEPLTTDEREALMAMFADERVI